VVSSYHAADVQSVSDFVPNPMTHIHTYGRNRFCIRARNSSKLAARGETKTLSLTYPHTEKSRGVKSGDRGAQAIVSRNCLQMGHLPRDARKPHCTRVNICR
jgi:hypothetical protein